MFSALGEPAAAKYALIIVFCHETDSHDSFYFAQPRLIINGVIDPPSLDPLSSEIVKRHVNAFILADHLDTKDGLRDFLKYSEANLDEIITKSLAVFGCDTCAEAYLREEFLPRLRKIVELGMGNEKSLQYMLYGCGFLPDWSFRRDQIEVIAATEHELHECQDNYLSERDPEVAFYKFAPGETVFMAGEVYCIKPDGPFESIVLDENNSFRSYKKLRAEKQVLYATRNKERRKYDQKVYVAKLPSFLDKGKILSIAYDPACSISFINYGCLRHKNTEPFEDS